MIDVTRARPLIRIGSEVTRRVRQHARAHMQTEVCGVLIGQLCDGVIEIQAPIEAFDAAQAGAHVTFTQSAWETIYKVKDREYPDDRIVGWYHSHPGFGVFLSDHDTFIHRNFFSSPDQVAWVYDPHSDEEGCFGWVDGCIRRVSSIFVADNRAGGGQPIGEPMTRTVTDAEWNVPQEPVDTAPAPPLPDVLVRPSPSRLLAGLEKALVAGFYFSRLLKRSFTPRTAPLSAPQATAEMPPPSNILLSGDATQQLPPGSGQ